MSIEECRRSNIIVFHVCIVCLGKYYNCIKYFTGTTCTISTTYYHSVSQVLPSILVTRWSVLSYYYQLSYTPRHSTIHTMMSMINSIKTRIPPLHTKTKSQPHENHNFQQQTCLSLSSRSWCCWPCSSCSPPTWPSRQSRGWHSLPGIQTPLMWTYWRKYIGWQQNTKITLFGFANQNQ